MLNLCHEQKTIMDLLSRQKPESHFISVYSSCLDTYQVAIVTSKTRGDVAHIIEAVKPANSSKGRGRETSGRGYRTTKDDEAAKTQDDRHPPTDTDAYPDAPSS
jgi:hypothetical protein